MIIIIVEKKTELYLSFNEAAEVKNINTRDFSLGLPEFV